MNLGKRFLAATALACGLCTAHASAPSLEDAFWACDYIATTRGTAAAPETCAGIYEELKAAKFAGDFDALVAWWQVNKGDAHVRIAEVAAAMPVARAASAPIDAAPAMPSRTWRVIAATRAYFAALASAIRDD